MNVIKIISRFTEAPQNRFLKHMQVAVLPLRQCNTKPDIDDAKYEDNVKEKILRASLPFVLEHGWTRKSIELGAESLGYPATVHGLFPRKAGELIEFFSVDCNRNLAEKLKKEIENTTDHDPFKFVHGALETRLRMIIPYIKTWPQAMSYMALPQNVPHSLANLLTLVDDICYYAGDRSVDINWYGRRIGLATMYKATEFYLVQDKSKDYEETWRFLDRRLDDLKTIHMQQTETEKVMNLSKDVLTSTFTTARNILGINWKR